MFDFLSGPEAQHVAGEAAHLIELLDELFKESD